MADRSVATKRGQYARSEETRARILNAAMALAEESGFQSVAVAAIARKAGVALGILNYHFGSKKQLLAEMMGARMNDFVSRFSPRVEGDNFFDYEASLLAAYLEYLHANPSFARLAEEVRHLAPELYQHGVDVQITELSKRIRTGIQQGDLRSMSETEVLAQSYLLQGAYSFLDRFLDDERYPGDEALLSAIRNLFSQGLHNPRQENIA